ncbi:MAG: TonB-dependent receptor [Steroidobacteraceae bacterium]
MTPDRRSLQPATLYLLALACAAAGATEPPSVAPDVEVVATPLHGLGVPRDQVPANVQVAGEADLYRLRPVTVAELLERDFASVHVNEAQSNPFQPDVSFRGFTASPLLGNPIGLSVYVDGVRVNESFGDTVSWDLVPTGAISSVQLLPGANPVFGLNTLGGALVLRTLSGRDAPGLTGRVAAGSFDRRALSLRAGGTHGAFDGLVALNGFDEDGWRDQSSSRVRQGFAKLGWKGGDTRVELALTHARNRLVGNGLAPEAWLEERREAVYTYPDESRPKLDFATLNFTHALREGVLVSASAYRRRLHLGTANGDAEYDDGGTRLDVGDDGYGAEFRRTSTRQHTSGATLQFAWAATLAGHANRLTVGASFDRGRSRFRQFEQAAEFSMDRGAVATGEAELDTDIAGFNRYWGVYLTDTLELAENVHLTASGRYNHARVSIADRSGEEPELDGRHRFSRFNPALGVTYAMTPTLTLYGAYDEGFRVPTPVELTCADPDAPCSLPVGFVADPPLDAVVAKSWEAGARGLLGGSWRWNATVYTTALDNDILFTAVGGSQGFFANVPKTRRRGLEFGVQGTAGPLRLAGNLAFIDATFDSAVDLFNPVANAVDPGQPAAIAVDPGDRLPGTPRRLLKLNADYDVTRRLSLGIGLQHASGQRLRGDESNRQPGLGGYTLVNLRGSLDLGRGMRLFTRVDNLLGRDYASLGALNRNGFDADGEPLGGVGPGPVQRFVSPGTPRSVWVGIEVGLGGGND